MFSSGVLLCGVLLLVYRVLSGCVVWCGVVQSVVCVMGKVQFSVCRLWRLVATACTHPSLFFFFNLVSKG